MIHVVEVRYAHDTLKKGQRFEFNDQDPGADNIQAMIRAGYWTIVHTLAADVPDGPEPEAPKPVKATRKKAAE